MHHSERRHSPGFTLIEAVTVIAITGVLAAVVSQFIVRPVQGYLGTVARAGLVDQADLALRRVGRDLRSALPNSVRVNASGTAVELIPTTAAARYATEGAGALEFGVVDTSFTPVGLPLVLSGSQDLVFYNLGPNITGSDAYAVNNTTGAAADSNRRTGSVGPGGVINLSSSAGLPVGAFAPPYRVTAVTQPVSYRCDTAAGTLTRHQNYGFQATQPDPPSGGSSSVVATGVNDCRFSVEGTLVAARAALVTLRLGLATTTSAGTETVAMHHAVFVNNLP
jgi:MSHA biogenesis protein MshO